MTEHVIPVAFSVEARSEAIAAALVVDALRAAGLIEDPDKPGYQRGAITCWWTPNHPEADGSDAGDPRLTWTR